MLGTPDADKKALTIETVNDVTEKRSDLVREVIAQRYPSQPCAASGISPTAHDPAT